MGKLRRLAFAVNRFARLRKRRNVPLEAFRETKAFKDLQGYFADALKEQGAFATSNVGTLFALYRDNHTEDEYKAVVGKWMVDNMPGLPDFISETKVYLKLAAAFVAAVSDQYGRFGVLMKASSNQQGSTAGVAITGAVQFDLTNPYYIAALKNHANYLLNRSTIDDTTRQQLIDTIIEARSLGMTIDETAELIGSRFGEISNARRSFTIANTEANQAMSSGQMAFMRESGVPTKRWIAAGPSTCDVCLGNEDDGPIPIDDVFSSGDDQTPAHPNCECYVEAGEIDLNSIDIWTGD